MGRNLIADYYTYPEVTQHTDVYVLALLHALAYHALDDSFTGFTPHKVLMQTSKLKPMTFERAMHDIECSEEVQFYNDPGKPCPYFMRWLCERHEEREQGRPPAILKWPEQFIRLGRKCPRPERLLWTPEDSSKVRQLFAINFQRREARAKRKGRG